MESMTATAVVRIDKPELITKFGEREPAAMNSCQIIERERVFFKANVMQSGWFALSFLK